MKEKVNDLVRLHKAMQEKLNKHHIQSKSKYLPWYLIKGLECTIQNILKFLNTLFQLHIKSKRQVEYQQNLLLKKEKLSPHHLVTNIYEDENFSSQMNEKKDYVSVCKEVHKQNLATHKSPCNLQELYTAFKEKQPNVNIGFSKFCALKPKWCCFS